MAVTRVCVYTRISTDEESQPTSLQSQRERLEAFCQAQEGWRIVAHKQDQATGTKLDRPGLQAALDLGRSGAIDRCSSTASTACRERSGSSPSSPRNSTRSVSSYARRRSPSTPALPPGE
jgi:hypothetical protein